MQFSRLYDLFSFNSEGLAAGPNAKFLKVWLMVLTSFLFILHPIALPALFKKELVNIEATENKTAVLQCELTKSTPVEWRKGLKVLQPSEKYKMRLKDTIAELTIHSLEEQDAGDYTCVCGDKMTTASLTVHGKIQKFSRNFLLCHLWSHAGSQTALNLIYYFNFL